MKRFICIILSVLTLLTVASCQPVVQPNETPASSDTPAEPSETPAQSTPESTPEPDTTPEETEPPVSYLEINGADISEYTFIYPKKQADAYAAAMEKFAEHIKTTFDVDLTFLASQDCEAEKVIALGPCNEYVTSKFKNQAAELENYKVDTATASIVRIGNVVWLAVENQYTLEAAIDKLIADTTPEQAGDTVKLDYAGENAVNVASETLGEVLKVMSYNVQTGTPSVTRRTAMLKNITDFMPDVIGTQEVNYAWISIFKLKGLLNEYELIGEPRNGNKDTDTGNGNEYSAILYRKSKFNLLDSGTLWLSETPDVVGSKLESSEYTRVMTYVVLERKSDGARFVHVNSHMSWDSKTDNTNLKQMKIILELVDTRIYSKYGELPTYFTGDFNVTMTSEGYKYLLSTGKVDARTVANVSTNENTFSGGSIIDYCIVTDGDFLVDVFDVGHGLDGSDHYPVYVQMYLIAKE